MARRRGKGRTERRRSYWEGLRSETSGTNENANVQHDSTLFSIGGNSNDSTTIVRIVGSVYLGVQASPAFVASVYYGIYRAYIPNSGTAFRLNPSSVTDMGAENWMFWKVVNEFQADLVHHYGDDRVDIKVMRKIDGGQQIVSSAQSTVNYHVCENLRGLFLAT